MAAVPRHATGRQAECRCSILVGLDAASFQLIWGPLRRTGRVLLIVQGAYLSINHSAVSLRSEFQDHKDRPVTATQRTPRARRWLAALSWILLAAGCAAG